MQSDIEFSSKILMIGYTGSRVLVACRSINHQGVVNPSAQGRRGKQINYALYRTYHKCGMKRYFLVNLETISGHIGFRRNILVSRLGYAVAPSLPPKEHSPPPTPQ